MEKLPRIASIEGLEKPAYIKTKWTDGTIRTVDMSSVITDALSHSDERFRPLLNWDTFSQVIVTDEKTLGWPNLPQRIELTPDLVIEGFLDLDPDVLYANSISSKT